MTRSAAPTPGASHVEVVEFWPARIRRPLDLIRLAALVAVLLLLVGLTGAGRDTDRGVNEELARLVGHVPAPIDRALRLVSAFGALALPLELRARRDVRGSPPHLI